MIRLDNVTKVYKDSVKALVEVSEVTRSGQTVRSARFMASRVVALVEHPAADEATAEARSRRKPPPDQPALDLG